MLGALIQTPVFLHKTGALVAQSVSCWKHLFTLTRKASVCGQPSLLKGHPPMAGQPWPDSS